MNSVTAWARVLEFVCIVGHDGLLNQGNRTTKGPAACSPLAGKLFDETGDRLHPPTPKGCVSRARENASSNGMVSTSELYVQPTGPPGR